MTQKQTDYDKALKDAKSRINDERNRWNFGEAVDFAFRKGYEYGKTNPNPPISVGLDHFRDSTKMMRYEIAKEVFTRSLTCDNDSMRASCYNNIRQHAKECVECADALIKELEKDK